MTERIVDGADVTDEEVEIARRYPMVIAWSPDDRIFVATFPDIPGLKAYGSTAGEAAQGGEDVVIVWSTAMLDAGRALPAPSALSLTA